MQKNCVGVVFGGVSNENEISIITGTMACNILKKGGTAILPIYIAPDNRVYADARLSDLTIFQKDGYQKCAQAVIAQGGVYLKNRWNKLGKFISLSAALNCCHGGMGEGGGLNGVFALADIPFAGAGLFESAAFLDKYYTKLVLSALRVPTVKYRYITQEEQALACAQKLGFPVIVKPARLGSSIGVVKVDDAAQLSQAVQAAFTYDSGVLIEQYVTEKREINCAAYFAEGKVVVSPCEESIAAGDTLTYEDKYAGGGKSVCPAEIPAQTAEKIRQITASVYAKLGMRGIVRFDFLLQGDNIYVSEINTVPGSLAYYLLSKGMAHFYPVLQAVLEQARQDFDLQKQKSILRTGIIHNFTANACKNGANKI